MTQSKRPTKPKDEASAGVAAAARSARDVPEAGAERARETASKAAVTGQSVTRNVNSAVSGATALAGTVWSLMTARKGLIIGASAAALAAVGGLGYAAGRRRAPTRGGGPLTRLTGGRI
ncbi:hypothetical protein G5C51_13980 [Streptomyces sp. A7024]|uniref:Uncharacterized protein n=1 Tax=Streptomyces coryli TaxID=1128680 RepID=A0A6G4TZQ9_9ACTN|nr:hypothetical protein [Streptomyces coryli]NGN65000.1 hypothetical protein [Streptomyces coryli]